MPIINLLLRAIYHLNNDNSEKIGYWVDLHEITSIYRNDLEKCSRPLVKDVVILGMFEKACQRMDRHKWDEATTVLQEIVRTLKTPAWNKNAPLLNRAIETMEKRTAQNIRLNKAQS